MNIGGFPVIFGLNHVSGGRMLLNILITCLIIIVLFRLLSIGEVHAYIERHSHKISTISRMFSILGIFSILFAAISISESTKMQERSKRIQEENSQILFENIKEEIDENLNQIASFRKQEKTLMKDNGMPVKEFTYYYLERSKDHMRERALRRVVNQTIRAMRSANDAAKLMASHAFVATDSKKIAASHRKFKEETVELIHREYERARANLVVLKEKLSEDDLSD